MIETACSKCVRPNCKDRKWNMFTCTRLLLPIDDDLEAGYQIPPIHFVKEPGEPAVQISGKPDPEGLKKFDEKASAGLLDETPIDDLDACYQRPPIKSFIKESRGHAVQISGEPDPEALKKFDEMAEACYQRPFIPGNNIDPSAVRRCSACGLPHVGGIGGHDFSADPAPIDSREWKTPLIWTDSLANTPDEIPASLVPPALHESYKRALDEAEEIWLDRQGQYGMTPFSEKPSVLLSLCQVKLWRLDQDFGAEDGWLDLLNYAAIGLMVARGEWE